MTFPLGKPILIMGFISLLGGAWFALRRNPPRRELTLWVFDKPQFDYCNELLQPRAEPEFAKSVDVEMISAMAMNMRLPVLFMGQQKSAEIPDVVAVGIESIGRYLRPPVEQIGFLPLNHYLETSGFREISSLEAPGQRGWNARLTTDGKIYTFGSAGWVFNSARIRPDAWIDRIIPDRMLPATKAGQIFGIPHDVHPVALAIREDLFREVNVPLIDSAGKSTVATWPEFQQKCLEFQKRWAARGFPKRHAIQLPESGAGMLSILLLQRHINVIDADFNVHLNDPKVASTLAFYVQLVAGARKISTEAADVMTTEYYKDLAAGDFAAFLAPDWQIEFARKSGQPIEGKLRLIPLPRFDPDDAPTAPYGGTFSCIPRGSPHPDEAWKLIEFLYLRPHELPRGEKTAVLRPLPEEWDNPQYKDADPFFGGQPAMGVYVDLARQIPQAQDTPLTPMALSALSYVQYQAVGYLKRYGPEGLEHQCQVWLDEATVDLKQRVRHVRFD
jgi:arabinosaccharide transport system substrate-binding protein